MAIAVDVRTILQEAWELYRRDFGAVLALALPVWIPCIFYEFWKRNVPLTEGTFANTLRQEVPVTLLVSILATSAIYSHLGRPGDLKAAARAALEFWSRMFITRFLTGLALAIGLLLLVIPGIYLGVRLAVAEPLILAEDIAGVDAMRRSWELSRGKFGRVLGWLVAGSLPSFVLAAAIFLPFAFCRGSQDWPMQALAVSLAAIPLTFLFPLYWVICDQLRREDYADLG